MIIENSLFRFPISNDPLYNSNIFGPERGKGGVIGKTKVEEAVLCPLEALKRAIPFVVAPDIFGDVGERVENHYMNN